jgi:hypothetical protein
VGTTDSRHDLPIAPNLLNRAQRILDGGHSVHRHRQRLDISGSGDRLVPPKGGGLVNAAQQASPPGDEALKMGLFQRHPLTGR